MSGEHKEILTRANARIAAGDIEGFLQYCTDDTPWTFVGEQTLSGKAAIRKYMEDTYVQPPKFDVKEMIADGNGLAAIGEITLTDARGKATTYSYCDVWHFRDGKLHELQAYVVLCKDH